MTVSGRGVFMSLIAMFMGRSRVLLRHLVLPHVVVMRGLLMVVCGRMMVRGCLMVMLC